MLIRSIVEGENTNLEEKKQNKTNQNKSNQTDTKFAQNVK